MPPATVIPVSLVTFGNDGEVFVLEHPINKIINDTIISLDKTL